MSEHTCSVKKVPVGSIDEGWAVECPTCGVVGVTFDLEGDAEAVATRHEEVGGFEKRH